jgi:hypothetical protein
LQGKRSTALSRSVMRLSYTEIFGRVFGQATLLGDQATWTLPQSCALQFQKFGSNYDNPGVNVFTLRLEGPVLVYEQETKWLVPCDGHPIGTEQTKKTLQRAGP